MSDLYDDQDREWYEDRIKRLETDYKDQHNHFTKIMNAKDDRIEQLESDIKEYKNVIDSLKQKLDVVECLYEDLRKENEELELEIKGLIGQHDSSDQ